MAIIKDPPPWSKDEQRELVRVLGPGCAPILRDLAWVRRWHDHGGFGRAWDQYFTPEVSRRWEAFARTVAEDRRRLRTMTSALRRAESAFAALSSRCRDELNPEVPALLAQLADETAAFGQPPRTRGRGRPQSEARRIAHDVGAALHTHGVRLTHGPDGRYARVLALVLASLNIKAEVDVDGLVRATIAERRT